MYSNKLENYLELLKIRRKGKRRDTIIGGVMFLTSFILLILDILNSRVIYLSTAMVVLFGFAFLTSWVRLEIIKGSIELIDNIPRDLNQVIDKYKGID